MIQWPGSEWRWHRETDPQPHDGPASRWKLVQLDARGSDCQREKRNLTQIRVWASERSQMFPQCSSRERAQWLRSPSSVWGETKKSEQKRCEILIQCLQRRTEPGTTRQTAAVQWDAFHFCLCSWFISALVTFLWVHTEVLMVQEEGPEESGSYSSADADPPSTAVTGFRFFSSVWIRSRIQYLCHTEQSRRVWW